MTKIGEEPCPECGGLGELETGWDRRSGDWEIRSVRCWECDGTGYLDLDSYRESEARLRESGGGREREGCRCEWVYDYQLGGKVPTAEVCGVHDEPFGGRPTPEHGGEQ